MKIVKTCHQRYYKHWFDEIETRLINENKDPNFNYM